MTSCCCLVEFGSSCFNMLRSNLDLSDSVLDILHYDDLGIRKKQTNISIDVNVTSTSCFMGSVPGSS